MFRTYVKNLMLVLTVALVAVVGVSKSAMADNNPVVGTWVFGTFSYDHRSNSSSTVAPAAWNRGTVTLNSDLTLSAVISESSNGNSPTGVQKGTYTITSDGQFDAKVIDPVQDPQGLYPVIISGRLDKTKDTIISSMMINPQQPALTTMVRQANLNPTALVGTTWVGQVIVYDKANSMRWVSINEMSFTKTSVTVKVSDSNNQPGGSQGTYQVSTLPADNGKVTMVLHSTDTGGDTLDVTAQISAGGDMGLVTVKSESTRNTVGMGTLIKVNATSTSTAAPKSASLS